MLFEDWCPAAPQTAWLLFTLMDSTEWKHLPDPGGLLDQDETLMADVALLSRMSALVYAQLEANDENDDAGTND